jgi:hypothetical protein
LSLNNSRISSGSDNILINPAFEDVSDESATAEIWKLLDSPLVNVTLKKIEESNFSKIGPRSIAKPWTERRESLFDYFKHEDTTSPLDSSNGRLRPVTPQTAAQSLLSNSSAGLPYMKPKGVVKSESLSNYDKEVGEYACVLYTRTQEGGKTRNVWGYPIADTIEEQRFFLPWLEVEKRFKFRSALNGPEAVDAAITQLLASKGQSDSVVCIDFSAYDASISPKHSHNAFSAIASQFQSHYHDDLYQVFRRFITIPVYTPDGEVSGPHGVPSGSSWTNTVDSLVQFAVANGQYDCQIQGDDGVYIVPKSDLSSFIERFKTAGLVVNDDKTEVFDEEATYLQRYYSYDYPNSYGHGLGGVYSLFRAFNRIKYLERWTQFGDAISGADYFALRTITILENCKHHPLFQEFVKLMAHYDGKDLTFSNAGLREYSRIFEAKTRANVFSTDNLESGINAFETMKILKKL